jgi:hypothetical protein
MKACCPSKKDYMTPTTWSISNVSVMFLLGCAVISLAIPIKALIVPMRASLVTFHHFQALNRLSMDNSNVNSLIDTPPMTSQSTATTITTTTTTIQVCGSKDCTRRGGGARLEKQVREVCEHRVDFILDLHLNAALTRLPTLTCI